MNALLDRLNDMQKEAVTATQGPVLVLAGAGSGKTTVLVNRLAYILDAERESPYRILAITFTNKAANEMKERIRDLIGEVADSMWIGTFHSMCIRILRPYAELLGYESGFVIYDTADTKTVMKECYKELNIDEKMLPMKSVFHEMGSAKDQLLLPSVYTKTYQKDYRKSKIAALYTLYQKKLKKNNAMDFDDIIVNTVRLLSENPEVLDRYSEKFKYIMVDEYQDTNNAQYMLVSLLAGTYRNLCVVGDDDQSIYKFRGANIKNILDFESQFPDARIVKLEQNYRSTQNILNAANSVIAHNKGRKGKNLWTQSGEGEKIVLYNGNTDQDEARYIAEQILGHVKDGGKFSDCAVLYRMNAMSRTLEEMFMKNGVPYRVLAGLRFYDRKEVKDVLAYLRLVHNPHDDVSLRRIINEPKRGVGVTTMDKAAAIAADSDTSIFSVIREADQYPALGRAASKLMAFARMIEDFRKVKDVLPLRELFQRVIAESGYSAMLASLEPTEAQTRSENINELVSAVVRYEEEADFEEEASLAGFLESVALISDIDNYDEDQDTVVLMTIHSAKGLEFPVVFLPGMENGIFPSARTLGEQEEMEEERRLCYVAITRAKERLYITHAKRRMMFGRTTYSPRSMFVDEIPQEYLNDVTPHNASSLFGSWMGAGNAGQKMEAGGQRTHREAGGIQKEVWNRLVGTRGRVDFEAGDRVLHKKFGEGVIKSAQHIGNDTKLEIIFGDGTKKILMAAFAKLEKI